jgi:hypothetical protein
MDNQTIQYNNLADRLDDVEETLRNMDSKIEKIYDVVVGNEKFDQQGVIGRLKKLESENENNKALKNKLIGAFVVGGAGWTIILELIKMLLRK